MQRRLPPPPGTEQRTRPWLACAGEQATPDGIRAHHDRRVPVAQHVEAESQEAGPEVVAVRVQLGNLAGAAVRAVLAPQQAQRRYDLLGSRRRHGSAPQMARRGPLQVVDQLSEAPPPSPVLVSIDLTQVRACPESQGK